MGPCATPAQHLFRRLRDHPRMLPRVAIAEDNSDLRRALERGLAEEGFDVAAASNGEEPPARGEDSVPDVLGIAIGPPHSHGPDVCPALRARGARSPVLFPTAPGALT